MPVNWPTAEAINRRITLSESVNGAAVSRLRGKGEAFIQYGNKYGINPGIVIAIAQRESQCGADGSFLPRYNNFGGITDPNKVRGTCGTVYYLDRLWANYCSAEQGIEGIFKVLDSKIYRSTDGTLSGVMQKYSPAFENDWNQMWTIFNAVGNQVGITLNPQTPVYTKLPIVKRLSKKLRTTTY